MLQGEHSAILLTFIKLPFVVKIFILSILEWPLNTGLTVRIDSVDPDQTAPRSSLIWVYLFATDVINGLVDNTPDNLQLQ